MPKFEDCESCAFHKVEPSICEECEDADSWEPDDELNQLGVFAARVRGRIKVQHANELTELDPPQLLKKMA